MNKEGGSGRASQLLDFADPCVRHVIEVPGQAGTPGHWPDWIAPEVRSAYENQGFVTPWEHQSQVAELAWRGQHVGVVTGTSSGKSAAFGIPALTAALCPPERGTSRGPTILYLSPTKALAHDQLIGLVRMELPGLLAGAYDGDTPTDERHWVRAHARWLVTNPDMLHRGILPDHHRWRGFLRNLRFIVVDEAHTYRGVFGANVALVLRRLRRVAAIHGASPTVIAASATVSDPAASLSNLIGSPVTVVDRDASARPDLRLLMWQPAQVIGEDGQPRPRSAVSEAAQIMTRLVAGGVQTLAFTRSRRGAETLAASVRRIGGLGGSVAAYRGGYLPEERRALESRLRSGDLVGLAATSALELGINISGLDAVILAGWPGTRASFWQQAGRAGRRGKPATAIFIAREDPLDQYLIEHPEAVVGAPLEVGAFDVNNPYVLAGHLCAAAQEHRLGHDDIQREFGPGSAALADVLAERGLLRRRSEGWFWTSPESAANLRDLRGTGRGPVRIVEDSTGRLLGTIDAGSAHGQVHAGAVYTHQGQTAIISYLDLEELVAGAKIDTVDYDTTSRRVSDVEFGSVQETADWGLTKVNFGQVQVTGQVVSYLKRRWPSGEVLGEFPLEMPKETLPTTGLWWTIPDEVLLAAHLDPADVPGSVHATEHAAIGLLPLLVTCDRWDIGGVSTARHPQTDQATILVYDGAPGGAGFAEQGFRNARTWIQATLDAVSSCGCADGCPGCVQSPKCGNGNNPLHKTGAIKLMQAMLTLSK